METLSGDETLMANQAFEQYAAQNGVKITTAAISVFLPRRNLWIHANLQTKELPVVQ